MRILCFAVVLLCVNADAEEKLLQNPRLIKFYDAVRALVLKHYPESTSHLIENTIHFEHNTQLFIVHVPLKTGEWQHPGISRGPKPGGVMCDIELREGRYDGAATVPDTFQDPYFNVRLLAPYFAKTDDYIFVHLYYPKTSFKPDFLKECEDLINSFEKYRD